MSLMMQAMAKNEAYRLEDERRGRAEYEAQERARQAETELRRQELEKLIEDARIHKMELESQKAAQQARQEAEEQRGVQEEELRRECNRRRMQIEEENRKRREEFELDLNRKREDERQRERQERKSRDIIQQISLWNDKTDAESYLESFQVAMEEAKHPVDQWVPTLRKRLTGKALATFREICPTAESSFSAVKADMLKRMGATV